MPQYEFSPFLRLQKSRRPFLMGGWFLFSFVAAYGCSGAKTTTPNQTTPSATLTIGLAEAGDRTAEDVGFQSVWPVLAFEGLMDNRARDGRPRPAIAESWTPGPDALSWKITLRPNVYFHDGTRCDAAAVKEILQAELKSGRVARYPGLLDIRNIRAEGDLTLIIELNRPSAFLLNDLYIDIAKRGTDGSRIGTGPFRVTSQSDGQVTLQAHRQYARGTPQIEKVVFKSFPTFRQAWSSLLRDEIEAIWNLSGEGLDFLTSETVQTFTFPRQYAYVMAFNSRRSPFTSTAVRRALNAAIDREAIVRTVLKGRGRPAYTPIWPDHWATDSRAAVYSFDPSLARTTLNAVGVGRRGNQGHATRLRFTCLVPQDSAVLERMALLLQSQLYDVGIDVQFESLPASKMDARLRSNNFDATLFDLISGPSLSRAYIFWHSPRGYKGGLNVFGYANPDVDKWLDRLRFATDDATVRAATSQLQHTMLEDPPAVFIAWSERSRAVSRRVDVSTPAGEDPFEALWKWRFDREQSVASE